MKMPVARQRLTFRGQELKDDFKTLRDQKLKDGSLVVLVARTQRRIAEAPVAGLYRCCVQAAMTHEAHNAEIASMLLPGQIVQIIEWVQVAHTSWRGRTTTGEHTHCQFRYFLCFDLM